ncbi:MAG TPA: polysaccharide pyruvyl transferase family protein [Thermohalobaculum sp.]|nr:polysaccharide pyruvyl transferase family protein [Thermohalobaculum sp.]
MKHAIFAFTTPNLGDEVQALAQGLVLPSVDAYVDRDRLDRVRLAEPHGVIMNSWFAVRRHRATPSSSLRPHYFGQCVGRPELVNEAWLAEWRRHQPIGCRDTHSVGLLAAQGIEARFTGCLTTFMGRFVAPPRRREGIVLVDVPEAMERHIPEPVRRRARRITNVPPARGAGPKARLLQAARLCDVIRGAEAVVTRRLHTALPCVGFGTPVTVYLKDAPTNRARFSGADGFLPIVLHDGERVPEGRPTWIEPRPVAVPEDMEQPFRELCRHFGTQEAPRFESVTAFAETLPDLPREPAGLRARLRRAFGL